MTRQISPTWVVLLTPGIVMSLAAKESASAGERVPSEALASSLNDCGKVYNVGCDQQVLWSHRFDDSQGGFFENPEGHPNGACAVCQDDETGEPVSWLYCHPSCGSLSALDLEHQIQALDALASSDFGTFLRLASDYPDLIPYNSDRNAFQVIGCGEEQVVANAPVAALGDEIALREMLGPEVSARLAVVFADAFGPASAVQAE